MYRKFQDSNLKTLGEDGFFKPFLIVQSEMERGVNSILITILRF